MFTHVALHQMPKKLQQLCEILQQASEIINQQYQTYLQGEDFTIIQKSDDSPVTQADIQSHQYICEQLAQLEPVVEILSEEGQHEGRQNWQRFWMLDPLDGTKEFIHKTGEFTINLSLIDGGESIISAIAVPHKQTIYISEKGYCPFRWQWQNQQLIAISQYQESKPKSQALLQIAMSRRPEKSPLYAEFLQYLEQQHIHYEKILAGSAYKFCMILEGEVDIYPRFHPTSEWDTAAGQGLLQSIGGDIFDLQQRPFIYNSRSSLLNGGFIALRQIEDWQYCAQFLVNIVNHE